MTVRHDRKLSTRTLQAGSLISVSLAALGVKTVTADIIPGVGIVVPDSYHLEVQTPPLVFAERLTLRGREDLVLYEGMVTDRRFGTVAHVTAHYSDTEPPHERAELLLATDARGRPARLMSTSAVAAVALSVLFFAEPGSEWLASAYAALAIASLWIGTNSREHQTVAQLSQPIAVLDGVVAGNLAFGAIAAASAGLTRGMWWASLIITLLVAVAGAIFSLSLWGQVSFAKRAAIRAKQMPPQSRRVLILGEPCIDRNWVDGNPLKRTWGSSALFVAAYLLDPERGREAPLVQVVGPYASDLKRLLGRRLAATLVGKPTGGRTLEFQNRIMDGGRKQQCRPGDAEWPALPSIKELDVLYVCPLTPNGMPDLVREQTGALQVAKVCVLIAQGVLRELEPADSSSNLEVVQQTPDDSAVKSWSGFDLIVFSDEDIGDAEGCAMRWSKLPELKATAIVVTRGCRGAYSFLAGVRYDHPVTPLQL